MAGEPTAVATESAPVIPAPETVPELDDLKDAPVSDRARQRIIELAHAKKDLDARVKAFEQYGTPETLAEAQQRLAYYDALSAAAEQRRQQQDRTQLTPDEKALEEARVKARTELRKIDPALAKAEENAAFLEAQLAGVHEDALEAQMDLMKEHGIDVTDATTASIGAGIRAAIEGDPKLKRLYFRNPEQAVKKAFDSQVNAFAQIAERKAKAQIQKDKQPLTTLPKTHTGGGAPGQTGPTEIKGMSDAHKAAKEYLRRGGSV